MRNYHILFGERNAGLKYCLNKWPTDELIIELKCIFSKNEEDITYHDIDKIEIIYNILTERGVTAC